MPIQHPRRAAALGFLAVLAAAGCTPAESSAEPRFTEVPADTVDGADRAAELLATATSASAPTTLHAFGTVTDLDGTAGSPDDVVTLLSTGDGAEVMTSGARDDLADLVAAQAWLGDYRSVDVAPCGPDVADGAEPAEAWHDHDTDEILWRSCVHVTAVLEDPDADEPVVTEALESVVLAWQVPPADDVVGLGDLSRVVLLTDEDLHRIEESGSTWYEYVVDGA